MFLFRTRASCTYLTESTKYRISTALRNVHTTLFSLSLSSVQLNVFTVCGLRCIRLFGLDRALMPIKHDSFVCAITLRDYQLVLGNDFSVGLTIALFVVAAAVVSARHTSYIFNERKCAAYTTISHTHTTTDSQSTFVLFICDSFIYFFFFFHFTGIKLCDIRSVSILFCTYVFYTHSTSSFRTFSKQTFTMIVCVFFLSSLYFISKFRSCVCVTVSVSCNVDLLLEGERMPQYFVVTDETFVYFCFVFCCCYFFFSLHFWALCVR